eukprot:scaffold208601_cov23-Cyclotella_meneghiniana.AAC.1
MGQRLAYTKKISDKLIAETGIDVEVNPTSTEIFSDETADKVRDFLQSDESNRSAAIAEYVFREHVEKYRQAKRN